MFSVYLQNKGFIGMLPILFGAIVGYLVAIPLGLADPGAILKADVFTLPHVTLPIFTGKMSLTAIASMSTPALRCCRAS